MSFFARFCAYAAVAVVVSAGLLSLLGLRFGKQSDLSQLLFESRRSEALGYRSRMVVHAVEVKEATVAEIVAGRLTLREAVARFQEVNELVENNDPDLVGYYQQKPTTEKGVYQQVLLWTRTGVSSLPAEQAKRILTPLEKEHESRFGSLKSATDSPGSEIP